VSTAAEVTIERRVEWPDTDAAGHQHHSVVLRWVEAAEAELLRARGLSHLFGRTPRVRYAVDYSTRLWFDEPVTIRLAVETIGRTSLEYAFQVHGPHGLAAAGTMVVVHAEPTAPGSTPWPADIRAALSS
jgi:acyl-CoA thioester hydrolase